METYLVWIQTYWGKPGYSTQSAAAAMNLRIETIQMFETFTTTFIKTYFNSNMSVPTEQQIIDAWHAAHQPVIYVPSPFGDVPEPIPTPAAPVDPLIGSLSVSEFQTYESKLIDARLEAHGLIPKQ